MAPEPLTVRPATAERWGDIVALLGSDGDGMFEDAGFRRVLLTAAHSAGRPRWLMRLDLS
ncbi:MAG: hypothetical protein L0221_11490 [Chloroflexi bacterium]|nr:hypothetical protein [Chloroflexota bacterium]